MWIGLGFGDDLIEKVMEEIVGYSDFEVNVDRAVLFLLSESYDGTWSSMEYSKGVLRTGTATVAGTSAADLLFSAYICKIMFNVSAKFDENGSIWIPSPIVSGCHFLDA